MFLRKGVYKAWGVMGKEKDEPLKNGLRVGANRPR